MHSNKSIFQNAAFLAKQIKAGKVYVEGSGKEVLVSGSRRTGRTVAQDKRDARKARNRQRAK